MTQKSALVYAIAGGGLVKIGTSLSVTNRLQDLRNMSPVRLDLIASGVGSYKEEKTLHAHFAEQRRHGEWFELSAEQIEELKAIIKNPNLLKASNLPRLKSTQRTYPRVKPPLTTKRRGGSVRVGTIVKCKWKECGKEFKVTNELRAYCCTDHRALSKGLSVPGCSE